MDSFLNLKNAVHLILLTFPGLVSIKVYRLLMPAKPIDWSNALIEGLFYSIINFAIFLPLIVIVHLNSFPNNHPIWYALSGIIILLVGPISWPIILTKIFHSKLISGKLQIQYPTSWDYFFDKREPVFILLHLKNGKMVGGYFGPDSYATSFPNEGNIYIQTVYKINDDGTFGKPMENSKGLLIAQDEYSYIELFYIPEQ